MVHSAITFKKKSDKKIRFSNKQYKKTKLRVSVFNLFLQKNIKLFLLFFLVIQQLFFA